MIIYLALPLLFAGLYVGSRFIRNEKTRHLLCALVPSVLLFLIFGLKGSSVGADSITYINAYHDLRSISSFPSESFFTSLKSYNFQNEYGFILFAQFFSKIGIPYLVFQIFVYAVICFCIFYSSWKMSANPIFSILIFVCFTFFNFYLSGLRQSFAMALCLFAITLIVIGGRTPLRTVCYFLLIGFAAFWHKSALIFIFPYFLWGVRINLKAFLFLIFISVFFYIFGGEMYELINSLTSSLFSSNYGDYAPFSFGKGLSTILLVGIIAVSYCLYVDSKAKKNVILWLENKVGFYKRSQIINDNLDSDLDMARDYRLFSLFVILTFVGVWLSNTNRFSISFGRIGMYFSVFVIFLLANSVEKILNKRIKYTLLSLLFVMFYAYFIYTAIIPNYLGIGPYTIIEGTI